MCRYGAAAVTLYAVVNKSHCLRVCGCGGIGVVLLPKGTEGGGHTAIVSRGKMGCETEVVLLRDGVLTVEGA